ncbi:MAG: hypothetical protein CSA96_03320 [Bacteroidetes bacterium]|nr:MAG: hypothetical protein CSA96_03320 [Bacteroidota bacterium]
MRLQGVLIRRNSDGKEIEIATLQHITMKSDRKLLGATLAVSGLFMASGMVAGQDKSSIFSNPISLGEVSVSSLRTEGLLRQLPSSIVVTDTSDFDKQSALSLSSVLDLEPGVSMGGDGIWATNVNIRGLGEQRLVTLVDGCRVETATELTASLSMIDVNEVERVEIVKGAQSALYGSGAMGGIVNILTKDGHFSPRPFFSGNVSAGYASANKLFSSHAAINSGSEKWYFRLSGTYADADNIRTPEGELPNSQYRMHNVGAKVGIKPFSNHLLRIQYQRNWSKDVGIPGGAAFPGPSEATYTDISRDLLAASYEISQLSEKLSALKLSYFTQFIDRNVNLVPNLVSERVLPNGNTQRISPILFTPAATHLTNGLQLQSDWELSDWNRLIAGVDLWGRKITSQREKQISVEVLNPDGDVLVTKELERGETPLPTSTFTSAGLFMQDEVRLSDDRLKLSFGGRLDGIRVWNEEAHDVDYLVLNGVVNDSPPRRITFEEGESQELSWAVNAGMLFQLADHVDFSLNLARSFRSPSLEERFKYIDLGSYVRLGDPSLKPEKGNSADLGLRVWSPRFTLQSAVFINHIEDMIVENPGEFIYTMSSGSDPDTLPALINSNVSEALLYGFDIGFEYNIYGNVVLFGSGAYVTGKDIKADSYLPLIPPLNGRAGVRYVYRKAGSIEFAVRAAAKQDRIADGETETDGYYRFDLAMNTKEFRLSGARLQLFLGIDNLTDQSYANHLSTNRGEITIEPGRNIYMRLKLLF